MTTMRANTDQPLISLVSTSAIPLAFDESAEHVARVAHVAKFHVQGGVMALCCRSPANLTREHQVPQRPDLVVRLCRACGRRHFVMGAEPGRIGLRL